MPSWKKRAKSLAADLMALPPDAAGDIPRVTCADAKAVVVEHVLSLLHVSPAEVRLDLGDHRVRVAGSGLQVDLVSGREVHLSGAIRAIEFQPRAGTGP